MNYCPVWILVKSGQTDRQTESDAYEPTMQNAQVGSKTIGQTPTCLLVLLLLDSRTRIGCSLQDTGLCFNRTWRPWTLDLTDNSGIPDTSNKRRSKTTIKDSKSDSLFSQENTNHSRDSSKSLKYREWSTFLPSAWSLPQVLLISSFIMKGVSWVLYLRAGIS